MDEAGPLAPLLATLRALVEWFGAAGVRGAIIGGVAASLLGRPRLTRDVDAVVLVPDNDWEQFVTAGVRLGFAPRRPDALDFARITRVLLMRHRPTDIDVDISFGLLPFEEETVARAVPLRVGDVVLPVASVEDLIVMKVVAKRARDIADVEGLLDGQRDIDLERVRRYVKEFAAAMEMPEIEAGLLRLLSARPEGSRATPPRRRRRR